MIQANQKALFNERGYTRNKKKKDICSIIAMKGRQNTARGERVARNPG